MSEVVFNEAAGLFEEGLPIGNGRLGAMVLGGSFAEDVLLNQDSIWYGKPIDRINKDARPNLKKVQELIFEGNIEKAQELLKMAFTATPESQRTYQTLGKLLINYRYDCIDKPVYGENGRASGEMDCHVSDYSRALQLEEGLVKETFCVDGHRVEKTWFSSYPDQVMVMGIRSEARCSMDFTLQRGRFFDESGCFGGNTAFMEGTLGQGGIGFMASVSGTSSDGQVETIGDHLVIKDFTQAFVIIACETSFYEKDYKDVLKARIKNALKKNFSELLSAHQEDYKALFDSVELSLPEDSYAQTYYQYGRYLLISSSRPGSLPANLQGIWNDRMEPSWDSKYTININTEMNYWPADMCGLGDCSEPLFDHLLRMWPRGKETAERMYGCRGFIAHHNTDIWGDCAPQDMWIPASYWVLGGAWLSTHIYMHYSYTKDRAFAEKMYPLLQDNILFFKDFLVERNHELFLCPSVSPENTYVLENGQRGCTCFGATMDSEILRDLFTGFLKLSQALNIEDQLVEEAKTMLSMLPEIKISPSGRIQEWSEDYEELEPGHRHVSHLYGLHPSRQISLEKTPELAEAAGRTLEYRLKHGGGHTGWSCAWIANFYARLAQGEAAYETLKKLWKNSTFKNMMDNHPVADGYVFQIDGNFGAISAMTEMLVSADENTIKILGALPRAWSRGHIRGIRVPGGIVHVSWEDTKLKALTFDCTADGEYTFIFENGAKTCTGTAGEHIVLK